jgi:hypothetical protein
MVHFVLAGQVFELKRDRVRRLWFKSDTSTPLSQKKLKVAFLDSFFEAITATFFQTGSF